MILDGAPFQNRKFMKNSIIGLIFLLALIYLGNIVYKNFNPKNKAGCAKGCGSCGAIDFDKIATQMESQMESQVRIQK